MTITGELSHAEVERIVLKGEDASMREVKAALRSLWADVQNAKEATGA